ncbi:metal ABC transporter solute-binding protein, Zn/Mn family [Mesorhizobium australicum]|uniref:metal ABC transporter solute-binding protein, Zn/Mn family n=1 Tax=Mesorhizobium australicum TaxID=536018 RepID=UPI001FCD9478|nr:zinc ABC transporter substrate-binding protein [Mesorhizobium australicum]
MPRLYLLASVATAATIAVAGTASAKPLKVVASFTVLADVAKEIGDSNVEVKTIVPPDGDPHKYEPTLDDAKNLRG